MPRAFIRQHARDRGKPLSENDRRELEDFEWGLLMGAYIEPGQARPIAQRAQTQLAAIVGKPLPVVLAVDLEDGPGGPT